MAVSGWADAPASTELDSVDAMLKTRHAKKSHKILHFCKRSFYSWKCGCICYLKTSKLTDCLNNVGGALHLWEPWRSRLEQFLAWKSPTGGHSHSTLRCLWASRSFAAGWSMMQSTGTPSSSLVTARLTRLVTVNNLSYVSSAVTSPRKTPAESVAAVVRGKKEKERIKS